MGIFFKNNGKYIYVLYEENENNIIGYSEHKAPLIELGELLYEIDPTSSFKIHKLYEVTPEDIKLERNKANKK